MIKLLQVPEMKGRLPATGSEAAGTALEEFAAYIKSETAKWAKVVTEAGVRAE